MRKFFERLPWQAVFFAFMGIFFLRNLLMPLVADDYSYAFIWDGEGRGNLIDGLDPSRLHRVESFSDIIKSQWSHYFTWGGRTIAHIFVQFFVWKGHLLFDVANTLVLASLVLLLFKIGTGLTLREMNKSYLLFILAGFYFCTPSLEITTVWLTGACNYLWMSTLIILFLLPFAMKYRSENFWRTPPVWSVPVMAVSGLLAGWSIEPGAAVAVSVTSLFILYFYMRKNLQPWMKVGFAFVMIGAAILFLSPGNFHRLELTNQLEPDELIPPDKQWTLDMFAVNLVVGFLPDFLRNLVLFVPIVIYFAKGRVSFDAAKFILTFAGASMLVLLMMMFSPEFPQRAGFTSTIFLMIAALAALKEILPDVKNYCRRRIKLATYAATIFAAVWTLSLAGCFYVECNLYLEFAERDKYIAEHKNDNLIVVEPLEIPTWIEPFLGKRTWDQMSLWWGGDIEPDIKGSRGLTFARYHGLNRIITKEKKFE